jgi:hypothetical protein
MLPDKTVSEAEKQASAFRKIYDDLTGKQKRYFFSIALFVLIAVATNTTIVIIAWKEQSNSWFNKDP